jgi:hypothetical protein
MVGCTSILQDENGDAVLLALYNFLPDGVSSAEARPSRAESEQAEEGLHTVRREWRFREGKKNPCYSAL